jgi:hypothetical protein
MGKRCRGFQNGGRWRIGVKNRGWLVGWWVGVIPRAKEGREVQSRACFTHALFSRYASEENRKPIKPKARDGLDIYWRLLTEMYK